MEKYFHFDRNKTLQELEGEDWGNPEFDSHLVVTCHELRKKPIGSFEVEDLRIMIGQNLSLDYLIPLALETLEDDIYADGDFDCGDLLNAVFRVELKFWNKNPIYRSDLENIISKNIKDLQDMLTTFRDRFRFDN
jgi:hypothetical protein